MKARWSLLIALLASGALSALAACKKPAPPHRTEPWLAQPSGSSSSGAPTAGPRKFRLVPESSSVRFSLPTRKAKLAGSVPVAAGSLELDPLDLSHSSASVEVDLTKLSIDDSSMPNDAELGTSTATELAARWLELGARVPEERRRQFSVARFELTGIENATPGALDLSGGRRGSRARVTAVGTLLLHGFREPVRVELALEVQPPSPGSGREQARLSIRSVSPLVIALGPHDISARDDAGRADALAMARSASLVGKNARIELELVGEPVTGAPNR